MNFLSSSLPSLLSLFPIFLHHKPPNPEPKSINIVAIPSWLPYPSLLEDKKTTNSLLPNFPPKQSKESHTLHLDFFCPKFHHKNYTSCLLLMGVIIIDSSENHQTLWNLSNMSTLLHLKMIIRMSPWRRPIESLFHSLPQNSNCHWNSVIKKRKDPTRMVAWSKWLLFQGKKQCTASEQKNYKLLAFWRTHSLRRRMGVFCQDDVTANFAAKDEEASSSIGLLKASVGMFAKK